MNPSINTSNQALKKAVLRDGLFLTEIEVKDPVNSGFSDGIWMTQKVLLN